MTFMKVKKIIAPRKIAIRISMPRKSLSTAAPIP